MQLVVGFILMEQEDNVVQAFQFLDLWVSLANPGDDKHSRHGIQHYILRMCVCVCVCVCVRIFKLISSEKFMLRKKGTIKLRYDISSYSCKFYHLILIRRFRRIVKSYYFLRHVYSSNCPHGKTQIPLNAFP